MPEIKYGDYVVDTATLPEASLVALTSRGLTHYLSNEVSSKVNSWAQGEGQANSTDNAAVKAWKEANKAAVDAKTEEVRKAAHAALLDGTVGTRTVGPRLTPLDTFKRQFAREGVVATLKANNIAVPKKKDDTIVMGENTFTMDQLIDRRLANPKFAPDIEKRAKAAVREQEKGIEAASQVSTDDL